MTWEKLAEHGIKKFEPVNATIFYYTSIQAAKEILLSGQLLMSNPEKFNDPFDLNPSLLAIDTSPAEGFELQIIEMYGNERADFKRAKYPTADGII